MWESRVAPLSGVLFALFLLGSFLVDPNTDFMPSESEVMARLEGGPVRVMAGAYVVLLAAAALLWFGGSLYSDMRRDDDARRLSTLALSGAVFASGLLAVSGVVLLAVAERVMVTGTIDAGAATGLLDVSSIAIGNGLPVGLAVMIGAWGLVALRDQRVRRWAGWVSLLLAIGLLSPFGWGVLAAALIWAPAVAIAIFRSSSAPAMAEVS